ncbi:ABC transporter substrate-binding protein [Atlantibacter subterraneus]|uniref:ABC transporter substrate-binding protein n=1 Tax=Atlantibacter subterraneus TaxID=255519 RepID=A0A427V8H1_9ENTR|nr:ABC transporter substrate-binding protein [Atlantibacter subterranea]MDZ5664626.1 ABC transporter substrate-binding protein [Atlantibacter hermannii]MDA3131530.1 ABC transporter substrate-binding protein [Atlantibacter subterranea]MDV7021276.1 ABC transporter substrate-binding protein [Atlantibacter subterranea]RSB64218.1 ABC transporter substrate-binding protein [Atlantibacter subterranea]RSE07992.1 ABC transporter substrate-binding protein [Atlantibacter subterranea]
MKKRIALFAAFAFASLSFTSLAQAQDNVTLRYLASYGGISAHELADALGYFKGTGVSIENKGYASGGPESLFALASGSVDIGSAATPAVLNSIASGNKFVAAYPTNGIDNTTKSIFYVREDSPIKTVKDLAGKSVAINTLGAHLDYTLREALRQAGLPQNAAKPVAVPGPQLEQVLRSGQVDVAAFGYWQTTFEGVARSHGGLRPVFNDTAVLGEIAGGFTVLREDFVQEHPEAAKTFVQQSARALDYAREHPEEVRVILAKALKERGENPEVAQYFTGYGVRPGGKAEDRDVQYWIDILERDGALGKGQLQVTNVLFKAQ